MKLFENVSGNQFRLLTESILSESNNVREGLKKVFSSAGSEIPYSRLQNVGLGYIKDITEARKCALQEAKELALEFGYANNEAEQKFVKENDFSTLSAENPEHRMAQKSSAEDHPEHDMSNPEESREVQIAKEILQTVTTLERTTGLKMELHKIVSLAQELIQMHRSK